MVDIIELQMKMEFDAVAKAGEYRIRAEEFWKKHVSAEVQTFEEAILNALLALTQYEEAKYHNRCFRDSMFLEQIR